MITNDHPTYYELHQHQDNKVSFDTGWWVKNENASEHVRQWHEQANIIDHDSNEHEYSYQGNRHQMSHSNEYGDDDDDDDDDDEEVTH